VVSDCIVKHFCIDKVREALIVFSGEQPLSALESPATLSASPTSPDDDSYSSSCSSYKQIVTVVHSTANRPSNKNGDAYDITECDGECGHGEAVVQHGCTTGSDQPTRWYMLHSVNTPPTGCTHQPVVPTGCKVYTPLNTLHATNCQNPSEFKSVVKEIV